MDWIKGITLDKVGIKLEKVGEKLVDRAFSIFETELSRFTTVEEQLNRLQSTLTTIHALLTDAEERRHITDDSVRNWLRELGSVAFDSDDLLDSHRTALAVHRLRSESSRKRKWSSFEFPSLSPEWGPLHRRRIALQIETINKNLDIISANRNIRFRRDDGTMRQAPNQRIAYSQQGSSHDPARVSGRETELNEIVTVLKADSGEGAGSVRTVPVVAIQGAAGIGKTTLARMIFHDSAVANYFALKVWVDLTDQSDVMSVTKAIYEKMTRRRCARERLDEIQDDISGYLGRLTKKKFLIVLDNFCKEGSQFWEVLRIPLLAGVEGSKVLITTRNESICRIMSGMLHRTNLTGLETQQCWDLFCSFAFPVGVERNERLVKISKEIAERCCGSPLAAKTLGALLNGQKEEEWEHVSHELRVLQKDIDGTKSSLLVSYHHLPYPIKKCFAYCCIFPNGYLFEKDQLIRYWLAEGLIPYEGRRRLEHVGSKFFDELIWRSFFEKSLTNEKSKGEKYRLSSLMHDLAKSISEYEFVDLSSNIPEAKSEADHFRYGSLTHRDKETFSLKDVYSFTKLRTLIVCSESKCPLKEVPPVLFPTMICLRVLDLGNSDITVFPEIADDQLIHLRYLGLSNTKIKRIPSSVCKLYNLQTLELGGCGNLVELPAGISKLVNLRHVGLHVDWEDITDDHSLLIPHGISQLCSLQTLSRFTVATYSDGNCNLCELENLHLRGDLCILNIEKVPLRNPEAAQKAGLKEKQYIENLMLRWSDSCHSDLEQWQYSKKVLENLQPNDRLQSLWLINYPGTSFPNWIGDTSFSSLETVKISNCSNFSFLPFLGQLPRLKNLQMSHIRGKTVESFVGFPSLEKLVWFNLPFLEKLHLKYEIPKLEKVSVVDCLDLRELVIHENMRGKFEHRNCPNLTVTIYDPED